MHVFGIIGGGMIAKYHAQAIQSMGANVKLGAIYARNAEKATQLGQQFNCKSYSELDQMLADPEITIVTIATPSGAHLESAMASAKAKKHIICEKPLEITPERCTQMIECANAEGVMLSGIFNRRFNPAVTHLKKAIEEERFGQLTLCDAQFKWFRTQDYYDSAAWRGTKDLDGGGAFMNQGIHIIDMFMYLIGSQVKRLSAVCRLLTHDNIEVEDTAVAILEFKNGAIGTIQGATSCWSSQGNPAEIQICGNKGTVIMTDNYFRVWDFKEKLSQDQFVKDHLMNGHKKGVGANDPNAIDFSSHQRNFEDVITAIENNSSPSISGKEASKAIKIINAIYQSAEKNGDWVVL